MSDTVRDTIRLYSDRSRDWLRHAATDLAAEVKRLSAPWYAKALAAILVVSAFCEFYAAARRTASRITYYAAAVRSMLQSWHNFFFVSFDLGGFVSVDKPPLAYWIQTLRPSSSGSPAGASSCRRRSRASLCGRCCSTR